MDRDTVTADGSKEITKLIRKAAPAAANEAEFRSRFSRVVEDFAKELEVRLLVREEYTLATGRPGAAYNRLRGECEVMGDKLAGIAVHLGARVSAEAGPTEVLVSSTVKDLVAGSGIRFVDRGAHMLKGIPSEWRLFAVEP